MPPVRDFRELRHMTPSEVITAFTSDPDWIEPSVVSGGRSAVSGEIQKLSFDKAPILPTSATGMTPGQRKRKGIEAVAVPVSIRFRECLTVVSGTGNRERTVGFRRELDLGETQTSLDATDKAVANVLKRRHERAVGQLEAQQKRLNPNKRQRELA